MKKSYAKIIIICAVVLRIILSLYFSDGTVLSDGITYLGITANITANGSMAAILPNDESKVKGKSVQFILEYLHSLENPKVRLLPFQWLHSLLYTPLILIFPTIYTIIIVNVLLLVGSGFFLFKHFNATNSAVNVIAWIILLFYPPLFLSTSSFYTEPLFIFLFSALWKFIFVDKKFTIAIFFAAFAICLTRPIGTVYVLLAVIFFIKEKLWKQSLLAISTIGLALLCNYVVMKNIPSSQHPANFPDVIEAIYFSNSPLGNGDLDYFMTHQKLLLADSAFSSDRENLLQLLTMQIITKPIKFLQLTFNKTLQMFFGIIPDSWIYSEMEKQSLSKRSLWLFLTIPFWVVIVLYIARNWKQQEQWYAVFLSTTFFLQLLILSRFRYLLPLIVIGIPFIAQALHNFYLQRAINKKALLDEEL